MKTLLALLILVVLAGCTHKVLIKKDTCECIQTVCECEEN